MNLLQGQREWLANVPTLQATAISRKYSFIFSNRRFAVCNAGPGACIYGQSCQRHQSTAISGLTAKSTVNWHWLAD